MASFRDELRETSARASREKAERERSEREQRESARRAAAIPSQFDSFRRACVDAAKRGDHEVTWNGFDRNDVYPPLPLPYPSSQQPPASVVAGSVLQEVLVRIAKDLGLVPLLEWRTVHEFNGGVSDDDDDGSRQTVFVVAHW